MSFLSAVGGFLGKVAGPVLGALSGRREAERNEDLQKDFAKKGIRWRVEDAKAAGIHPLYAIGGNVPSYTPTVSSVPEHMASLGQNIGRAMGAAMTSEERELHQMNLAVMRSQLRENDARASYYESEAARVSQANRASSPFPGAAGYITDLVNTQPDKMVSSRRSDPSVGAGIHPAMREYVVGPSGLKMRLPYSEEGPGEAMENIPFYLWPTIIQHNRAYYGDDWGERFIKEFVFGKSPKYVPESERPPWWKWWDKRNWDFN